MHRFLAATLLAMLCACSGQAPPAAPAPPSPAPAEDAAHAPAAAPAGSQTPTPPSGNAPQSAGQPPTAPSAAPATSAQSETQQATSSQESGGEASDHQPGDASLEKMTSLQSRMPDGRWKAGVNYDVLVPARATSVAPGKIEVLEVFWLGCPHCYDLEPFIRAWLKTKPPYVEFVRVPVIWQAMHRAHARLYYTIEALGRPGLFEKAFDTIHQLEQRGEPPLVGNSEDETFRAQQAFAVQNGVSAEDFARAYNSFSVNTDMQRAEEITQRYQVQGVPFIAVNGKYTTDIGKAGGETQLISLINDLVAAEHGR